MSGKARIGSTVIGSSRSKSDRRVLQVRRGRPLTSALHEPHLAALQFQRTARSGRLVALDPVEGVEDDHPLLDRARRTRRSGRASPGLPRKTLRCASGIDRSVVSARRRGGRASSSGIVGSGAVRDGHRAVARERDDAVDACPSARRRWPGWSRRLWAPRLSVRCRALRVIASETISRLRSSKTRFQPGL